MYIYEEGNRIVVQTEYEERTVPKAAGGTWNGDRRHWETPLTLMHLKRLVAESDADDDVVLELDETPTLDALMVPPKDAPKYKTVHKAWAHQVSAIAFGYAKNALLNAYMGTGKTKMTLDTIVARGHRLVLVVCPKSISRVWEREVGKHMVDPMPVLKLTSGSIPARAKQMAGFRHGLVIINYESVWRGALGKAVANVNWDCVVFDESTRIKNVKAQCTSFCIHSISAKHRLALSGTPMADKPIDIMAQVAAVEPHIWGTNLYAWRKVFCKMGGYMDKDVVGYRNEGLLNQLLAHVMHTVPQDALDLPPVETIDWPVVVDRSEYQRHLDEISKDDAETIVLTKLLRARQAVNTQKKDALADLLKDFGKEPVVVFSQFHADIDMTLALCGEMGLPCGELSSRRNDIEAWDKGNIQVFAVQAKAGGMGIDLTRSRYVVYLGLDWSAGAYDQSVSRVHRPGQSRSVAIYRLLASDTIDDAMAVAVDEKRNVIEAVMAYVNDGPAQTPATEVPEELNEVTIKLPPDLYKSMTEVAIESGRSTEEWA